MTTPHIAEHYPPNPTDVPKHLTRATARYRLQARLVVASLFVFLLVYLGLIAGSGFLCYWCVSQLLAIESLFESFGDIGGPLMISLYVFLALTSLFLALYLVKGLFKSERRDEKKEFEITEAEQPRLFAFIRQICKDTKAPEPAKIVVSPDVNAGVYYRVTFWSLFFPPKKNLHIGLGLVNCLNLSEFKAVMAHEFGHFSQKSLRLGSYVYTANRILYQIVYGRDSLDEYLFKPILSAIRWLLGRIFAMINFAHSSLSRQMEFQADLVAVSVAGSDAIVHGFVRSDFAHECLTQTSEALTAASDHDLHTDDLFYHQSKTADYLRVVKDDAMLGVPPELSDPEKETVFEPNDTTLPPMWASHPPHFERETNCKRTSIQCPQDDRSAWLLFDNVDDLRQRLTKRSYEAAFPGKEIRYKSAEKVQQFIDDERAETVYAARYDGMYEEGRISPGLLDKLEKKIPQRYTQPAELLREHNEVFNDELKQRLKDYRQRRDDRDRLARFANKVEVPKKGMFEFRGKQHRTVEAAKLVETLTEELTADRNYLASLDQRIYLVYMGMARQLGLKTAQDLEHRYRFHLAVQEMIDVLLFWKQNIHAAIAGVASEGAAKREGVEMVAMALRESQDELQKQLTKAGNLRMPAFKNMQAGRPLAHFLDAKPVIHNLFGTSQIMNGTWINQILQRQSEIIDKLRRVIFKSIGSLLCFQERVGEKWKAKYGNAAAAELRTTKSAPEQSEAELMRGKSL